MRPGRRASFRTALAVLVLAGLLGPIPGSSPVLARSAGQAEESAPCPAMTDSIDRLYLAYFDRPPSEAEFLDGTTRYRNGAANLETIAQALADSDEFGERHGELTDEQYVDLVYRTAVGRPPSEADREYWVANLASGYRRGSVMVAFSESEDFISRTKTATPLSGFLRWYPEGVHWYCGRGPRDDLAIRPLSDPTGYADYVFYNGGDIQSPIGLKTVLGTQDHLTMSSGTLPPRFTSYEWDGLFTGDGDYGSALDVQAGRNTSWIVVFYPSSIGSQRPGWQIAR